MMLQTGIAVAPKPPLDLQENRKLRRQILDSPHTSSRWNSLSAQVDSVPAIQDAHNLAVDCTLTETQFIKSCAGDHKSPKPCKRRKSTKIFKLSDPMPEKLKRKTQTLSKASGHARKELPNLISQVTHTIRTVVVTYKQRKQ